jgi:hypothetical protein
MTQEELVNIVLSSAQTLSAAEDQVARAATILGASASTCTDSGVVDAYEPAPTLASVVPPTSYAMMDGFLVYFEVAATNTGASTCDYNSLGAVPVTDRAGGALVGGELVDTVFLVYNASGGRFELLFSSASASAGVASLTGEATVVTIGGTPSIPHVSLTALGVTAGKLAAESVEYSKLSDSATASNNVKKRVSKAWCNFDGTGALGPQTIRATLNILSVTRTGTGVYFATFVVPMTDVNYHVSPNVSQTVTGPGSRQDGINCYGFLTNGFSIETWKTESALDNMELITFSVVGN